jgi:hypothetical protein
MPFAGRLSPRSDALLFRHYIKLNGGLSTAYHHLHGSAVVTGEPGVPTNCSVPQPPAVLTAVSALKTSSGNEKQLCSPLGGHAGVDTGCGVHWPLFAHCRPLSPVSLSSILLKYVVYWVDLLSSA